MFERRLFLKAGLASALVTLPGVSLAAPRTDRRLVIILQRGGQDGLHALPPHGDPNLKKLRPRTGSPSPSAEGGALGLDGLFGLHPELQALHRLYGKGELAVFPAIASRYRSRSHFDGQNMLENGSGVPFGASSGWLNRALEAFPATDDPLGLNIGLTAPLMLRGPAPIKVFAPAVRPGPDEELIERLMIAYSGDPVLADALAAAAEGREASEDVSQQEARKLTIGTDLPVMAETVGRLLSEADGPRVAVIESNGWDTHDGLVLRGGRLFAQINACALALEESLAPVWSKTAVLTLSEFGRTAAENGSLGSDHGTGGTSFLFGGAVRGGQIVGDWPGLRQSDLFEGRDLYPVNSAEAVLKTILVAHLGVPPGHVEQAVFPGSRDIQPMEGLFRA